MGARCGGRGACHRGGGRDCSLERDRRRARRKSLRPWRNRRFPSRLLRLLRSHRAAGAQRSPNRQPQQPLLGARVQARESESARCHRGRARAAKDGARGIAVRGAGADRYEPRSPRQRRKQPVPQQPAPQQPAAPTGPSRAELQQAREHLAMLGVRASGVRTSLQSLQRSQAASGMNLRGDMQDAANLMTTYLNGADAALNAGDVDAVPEFRGQGRAPVGEAGEVPESLKYELG